MEGFPNKITLSQAALGSKVAVVKSSMHHAWARDVNITPEALSMAKIQGRLSTVLSRNLAIELGDDPVHWTAVAAIEATRESEQFGRFKNRVNSWRRL